MWVCIWRCNSFYIRMLSLQRSKRLVFLNELKIEVLLFGNDTLTEMQNLQIFKSVQKQETSKVPKMCFFCFLFVRFLFFNHFWAFILFLIRFSLCRRLSSNFMNDVIFWCIPLSLFKDYWTLYSSILYIWHSCCLF